MAELAIETPRLRLREWRDADLAPFREMCADVQVMRYFPPIDHAGVEALVARQRAAQSLHGHCFWAAERRSDGAFIGVIGLGPPRFGLTEVEVGWRLARSGWGKGYASEGGAAALAWGFARLGVASIVAITVPANTASVAVMVRIGMVACPEESFDLPDIAPGDPLRRHVLYRAHRPEHGDA